jgi:hypothetical protein
MSLYARRGSELSWGGRERAFTRRCPWPKTVAFGVAFTGTLAVAMLQGAKPFYGDSSEYWGLASTFTVGGHFSLLNFHDPTRGYVLPLINLGLQTLANAFTWTASSMAKLFNVFTVALIGVVLGPAFVRTVWPTQPPWGVLRRLALTAFMVVFWSGYLNFPLSDFPGLAVGLLALIAVARTDSPGWMLLAGAALGAAIDMREAYLPLIAAVVALVIWAWFEQRGTRDVSARRRVCCAALLLVGFAVVSLPQSLSAHRYHETWSFVPAATTVKPAELYYTQGLWVQGYDTYIGHGHPGVAMNYVFPAGQRLLEEQPEGRVANTSQYLGLFVSHPLTMADLILRHVVNGLDPLYSTPYVENLNNAGRTWGRIAAFLIVFLALLRLLWPAARRRLGPGRLRFLLALSLCSVTPLPSSMERRYLLPVYLLLYAVALMPGWPSPIGPAQDGVRRYRVTAALATATVAFTAVVWYITSDAISHLRVG